MYEDVRAARNAALVATVVPLGFAALIIGGVAAAPAQGTTHAHHVKITEDSARFNPRTMGNRADCLVLHGHKLGPDKLSGYELRICQENIAAGARWHGFRPYDGHKGCEILVGDTSIIRCRDGFAESS